MAKLCVEMCPILTAQAIENFGHFKIFTVLDVLREDPAKLGFISKLEFTAIVNLRKALVSKYSPFPRQGLDAYYELKSDCSYIPSGIKSLDKMLGGGFLTGNIYELCGMCGTGKTQLCLTIAVNVSQQQQSTANPFKVHFIDTKMDFSGKRVLCMLDARSTDEAETGNVMERILVTKANDFTDLYSFLYSLKEKGIQDPGHTRLVIVDSLPAIFLQYMGSSKLDSLGLMNCLVSLMRYLGQEQHVAFVLVNLASKWVDGDSAPLGDGEGELASVNSCVYTKPALGKYWAHIPNTRLHVQQLEENNERRITVIKSSHLSVGKYCCVKIQDEGVL